MARSSLYVVIFGPPAVGKGAQAAILARREGIAHLSTGDLLREEIARQSELGRRVAEAVARGEYADDATVLAIVKARFQDPSLASGAVLDGFPRTLEQARSLDEFLRDRGARVDHALLLSASESTVLDRLSGRRVCPSCGQTFHVAFKAPRRAGFCDACGAALLKRHDDNLEVHRERLRVYREKTQPLIDFYRRAGVLREVDGSGTIDEVAGRVAKAIAGGTRPGKA
jgi:adenylate kinase